MCMMATVKPMNFLKGYIMKSFKFYFLALAEHHRARGTFLSTEFSKEYNALLAAFFINPIKLSFEGVENEKILSL